MLVNSKDLYEMQTVKTLIKCQYNTAFHLGLHFYSDKSSFQRKKYFLGKHNLDPSIYRMVYSDFIVSQSLKRDKVSHSVMFCFQDIAYVFIQFYKLLLNGLVYHCREQDEVCSPNI